MYLYKKELFLPIRSKIFVLKSSKSTNLTLINPEKKTGISMRCHIVGEEYKNPWNRFVRNHPHSTVFHLWEWGNLSELYGHQRYYIVVEEKEKIVGVLPLIYVRSYLFNTVLVSIPYCEYGYPLVKEKNSTNVLRKLIEKAKELAQKLDVDFVELRDVPQIYEGALENKRFVNFVRFVNFELDLTQGINHLWEQFEERERGAIMEAKRKNVRYKEVRGEKGVKTYYQLVLKTMHSHGSPPPSYDYYKTMWTLLQPQENAKMYIAYKGTTPINGMLFLPYQDTIAWKLTVSDPQYRRCQGGTFLFWKALQWGAKNGFKRFLLGRTREGTGVYLYKKNFNPQKLKLNDYFFFPGEVTTPSHPETSKNKAFENLWKKLPLFFTQTIGPYIRGQITL